MRSMTCKAEIRQLLIASGAIKVILDDATNQVIELDQKRPLRRFEGGRSCDTTIVRALSQLRRGHCFRAQAVFARYSI